MAAGDLQRRATEERLIPTIFALATGAPPTAIAIIRIAGPRAFDAAQQLTGKTMPPPRRLVRRTLYDSAGEPLDVGLIAAFPGPASVTGDDVVELHVHGGVAVVTAVLARLDALGLSPAAAGAFTRRAFDNGKLDLAQVEALGDLTAAETEAQRRAAIARAGGELARSVDAWRATLIGVRADVEASLDFAEEDGVAVMLTPAHRALLTALAAELRRASDDGDRGARLRDGLVVAIVGPVNAGKSTLLNALARRDAAIVSPFAGTTRDAIAVPIALRGVPVTLVDTAGIRSTDDPLEAEGIRRAVAYAASADLVVALDDVDREGAIRIVAKSDARGVAAGWRDGALHLSAETGDGIDLLEAHLADRVTALTRPGDPPLVAHRWQMTALDLAQYDIAAALAADESVVVAEELRRATASLGQLFGRVASEQLLDTIFARFCVGK